MNSHHYPNLDIAKLSKSDTGYTCDPDMCVEINFVMPLVSISFAYVDPYLDAPKVHMTAEDKEDFDDTCAGEGTDLNRMSNLEASTIPIMSTTASNTIKKLVHNHSLLCIEKLICFKDDNLLEFSGEFGLSCFTDNFLLVIHVLVHSFVKHVLRLTNAYCLMI